MLGAEGAGEHRREGIGRCFQHLLNSSQVKWSCQPSSFCTDLVFQICISLLLCPDLPVSLPLVQPKPITITGELRHIKLRHTPRSPISAHCPRTHLWSGLEA